MINLFRVWPRQLVSCPAADSLTWSRECSRKRSATQARWRGTIPEQSGIVKVLGYKRLLLINYVFKVNVILMKKI